jgi:hypothetical protein
MSGGRLRRAEELQQTRDVSRLGVFHAITLRLEHRSPGVPDCQLPQAGFVSEKTNQARKKASAMTEIAEHEQTERERVAGWRLHVLIEAGYPVHLAERVAHSDADLHQAVELVRLGCDATVAAEILL